MNAPVYYKQLDSTSGHSHRMCFSSCCAMVIASYRRDEGKTAQSLDPDWDDEYLRRVFVYGDTTSAEAQRQAIQYYGYDAEMRFDQNLDDLYHLWVKNILAPCGMLIRGPISAPSGGGHYVLPYAVANYGRDLIVHDPYGEQDLVNGGFVPNKSGRNVLYSKENFRKRWMVQGPGTGWAMIIRRKA
jgi:hypothetical protein